MIRPLAAAPEARAGLARLMRAEWPDWYGPGGSGDAEADLAARARAGGLPFGVVALGEDGEVLGGAALDVASHGAAPGEAPWLVGLLVAPWARGRGVGSALVAAVEAQALRDGGAALLATTGAAAGLLRRRGWRVVRALSDGQGVWRLPLGRGGRP